MENQHIPEELTEWEQVHSPSVFPPGNHQDLPISVDRNLDEEEPTGLLLPSAGDDGATRRWKRLNIADMKTAVLRVADWSKKYITCNDGRLCSFAGGVSLVLLLSFLHRRVVTWWKRRSRLKSGQESRLVTLLREKDEVWANSFLHSYLLALVS